MIRVRNIKLLIEEDNESNLKNKICKKLRINNITDYKIVKKSIDARDKESIYYSYEIDCNIIDEDKFLKKNKNNDVEKTIYDHCPPGYHVPEEYAFKFTYFISFK